MIVELIPLQGGWIWRISLRGEPLVMGFACKFLDAFDESSRMLEVYDNSVS